MSADRLVRCTKCLHHTDTGTWCPEARKHAGGKWLRHCGHYATRSPGLGELQALPGLAEARLIDGRLWLRFHRHATSEQREHATELVTGQRPVLQRAAMPRPAGGRGRTRGQSGHGGRAA